MGRAKDFQRSHLVGTYITNHTMETCLESIRQLSGTTSLLDDYTHIHTVLSKLNEKQFSYACTIDARVSGHRIAAIGGYPGLELRGTLGAMPNGKTRISVRFAGVDTFDLAIPILLGSVSCLMILVFLLSNPSGMTLVWEKILFIVAVLYVVLGAVTSWSWLWVVPRLHEQHQRYFDYFIRNTFNATREYQVEADSIPSPVLST